MEYVAFQYLAQPIRVARAVLLGDEGVVVVDTTDRPLEPSEQWVMTLPLGKNAGDLVFGAEGGVPYSGQERPLMGWHSDTYGEWHPSPWIRLRAGHSGLPVWGCGSVRDIRQVDDGVVIDGLRLCFEWSDAGASLIAEDLACGAAVRLESSHAF